MRGFIQRFAWFSASGFLLSLVVHIIGLLNKAPFFVWFAIPIHFGVFVALFGAAVAFLRLRQSEGKGFWRRALRASPAWMRWVLLLFLIYSLANFFIFWNALFNLSGKPLDEVKAIILRGFSGHWMVFYFGTFLVFYAALQATQRAATSKA